MTETSPRFVLPDTNVLVHSVRRSLLYQHIEAIYGLSQRNPPPFISIVTRGEILSLAAQFGWGQARRLELQQFVALCVTINLDHPGLVETYAELDAYSLSVGREIGDNDL